MSTVLQITRGLVFIFVAAFASSAWAVTVSSALGGASLNGAWGFGCSDPDFEEGGIYDEQEFLIYKGNTVESRVYLYASDNETCSGGVVAVESEGPFDFFIEKEPIEVQGWGYMEEDEFENEFLVQVPPPARQDGKGSLPAGALNGEAFYASVEIFVIPGEGNEAGCVYVDDTDQTQNGLNWYLYRCSGEDDAYIPFLDFDEPLVKSELPINVIPVPAGIWLFGTALIGFIGYSRRRNIG